MISLSRCFKEKSFYFLLTEYFLDKVILIINKGVVWSLKFNEEIKEIKAFKILRDSLKIYFKSTEQKFQISN
jgi:hypothetical protein